MEKQKTDSDEWLNIRVDDIPDPLDKCLECRYFLQLLERESDQKNFRWLISAFISAAYSFFETANFSANKRYPDEALSQHAGCEESFNVIKKYVISKNNGKGDRGFTTSATAPLLKQLYALRNSNTHRSAFLIKTNGGDLPNDFMFGFLTDSDVPALAFCKEVVALIDCISEQLQEFL
jgi:hypothetical protein